MAKKKLKDRTISRKKRTSHASKNKELKDSIKSSDVEDSNIHKLFKVIVVIVLLPLLVGFVKGLVTQINAFDISFIKSVYWGIASYLILHLFLFEPTDFYSSTQKFTQHIFGFLSPLFKVSYYIIPFWAIGVIGAYFLVCRLLGNIGILPVFYFLSGFVFTMHVVMVAAILRTEELKGFLDYLFVILVVIAINIFFLGLNLKLYNYDLSIAYIAKSGVIYIKHLTSLVTALIT